MTTKYVVGADPELFLQSSDGKFKSAHRVIPGTKEAPHPVMNGAIQVDGVAAEFNIAPAETAQEFHENIRNVLEELQSRVATKGLALVVSPTATFDKGYFKNLPKKCKELGCEPDYNVYSGINEKPRTKEPFRTGGGHIHIGWTDGQSINDQAHQFDCHELVKQLDSCLYPMSLLWDDDDRRRSLYGKIGSYRPKHYGVEYRPLSNAWVADPDLHIWIFETSVWAAQILDDDVKLFTDYFQQSIIKEIKEGRNPSRSELLQYHDYLVDDFYMPKMPEGYIRSVN